MSMPETFQGTSNDTTLFVKAFLASSSDYYIFFQPEKGKPYVSTFTSNAEGEIIFDVLTYVDEKETPLMKGTTLCVWVSKDNIGDVRETLTINDKEYTCICLSFE
jgi:hypothetical protein